jgi:outer membrane protein
MMNNRFHFIFLISISVLLYFSPARVHAQAIPVLTLQEAIERGIANNANLKSLEMNQRIAMVQNTKAAAGYYPTLQLNASHTHSLLNTQLNFFDGREISQRGAYSNNTNAGLSFVWNIFDGNARYHLKKQLEWAEATQNSIYIEEVERVMYRITLAYLNVVRQQELLDQAIKQLNLSKKRLELAIFLEEKGSGNALSVLQNKVNTGQDSIQIQRIAIDLQQARKSLLLEMSETIYFDFNVAFTLNTNLTEESKLRWLQNASKKNISLQRKRLEILETESRSRQLMSTRFPEINLVSTLQTNLSNNQANFVIQSSNIGPAAGITLTYPIFDNGQRKRQIEVSNLQKDAQVYQLEHMNNQLNNQLQMSISQYDQYKLMEINHQDNVLQADKLLQLSEEMYRLGRITDIEVREAQLNAFRANSNLVLSSIMRQQHFVDAVFLAGELREKLAGKN